MNNKQTIFKISKFALGAVVASMMGGAVAHADGLHVNVDLGTPNVVVAPNTFAPTDDYVYYPQYNVYYGRHSHKYAYMDHGSWVAAPAPSGVTVDALHGSPSVDMDFHDSPANHHRDVVKRYPKDYRAKDVHGDDHRDDHAR